MKAAVGLCFLTLAGTVSAAAVTIQRAERGVPISGTARTTPSSQAISFHNPYTGGTVYAQILLPLRVRALGTAIVVTGSSAREQQASESMRLFLAERGYSTLRMPTVALSGTTDEDTLNTVAALHYLQAKADVRGTPVGIIGYGDGVRLAATAAAQDGSTAFVMLLGGAIVPDHLNSVPSLPAHRSVPQDDAAHSLDHVRCPVLVLLGEYDRLGTHHTAAANAEALKTILDTGRHKNYTIKVVSDSDVFLADTGPGGAVLSPAATPPSSVWKTAADWMSKQVKAVDPTSSADYVEPVQTKPIRIYPKSVYGEFPFRSSLIWQPVIGGQTRPYGFWYW